MHVVWLFAENRFTASGAHRRRPRRIGFEVLEDRLAPATFTVNSLADLSLAAGVNTATGAINGTNTVTLRSAIEAANLTAGGNIIDLSLPGTYKITLAGVPGESDNLAGEFAVLPGGGNLTIQNTSGGSVVVDGNHLGRVFDINPTFNPANPTPAFLVSFTGFTIQNGVATDVNNPDGPNASGGGIRDQGNASLTLNNVIVTNNIATADGGGISMENTVSAPWTLTINNSTISNNHAGDAGGGVEEDGAGKVFITNSTISGNTCVNQGAGVWLDAIQVGNDLQTANLTVTNSILSDNSALTGVGGGIGNAGNGTVTITDSTVENNFAANGAGFGDAGGVDVVIVQNSLFLDNATAGEGGALFTQGPTTTITDSLIQGNSAAQGGGVFADGVTLTVTSSTVAGNSATSVGGGFEIETTGTGAEVSTITNTTVTGNSAVNNAFNTYGGGINSADFSPARMLGLLNDTINYNFASIGGGLYWAASGYNVSLQNTIIAGNFASSSGPDVTSLDMHFTDNGGNLIGNSSGTLGLGNNGTQVGAPPTRSTRFWGRWATTAGRPSAPGRLAGPAD